MSRRTRKYVVTVVVEVPHEVSRRSPEEITRDVHEMLSNWQTSDDTGRFVTDVLCVTHCELHAALTREDPLDE